MDETHQQPEGNLFGRRRLGRGLNSLIGAPSSSGPVADLEDTATAPVAQGTGEYLQIDVDQLERNPFQPRKEFAAEALQELVDSVTQYGVLQPLLIRATEQGYQLIAGERRLIAARKAGLRTVPCRLVEMNEQVVSEVAIIENLQRADLNELEKAQAFHEYIQRYGCTIEELARKMGKDRSTVSNSLRLLELPDFVKLALQSGKISAGHGRALLPLEEEADQIAMCQRIQSESMSVRQTEEQVRAKLQDTDTVPFARGSEQKQASAAAVNNHVQSLQQQLRDLVGAKVELKMKGKDAGRMILHFSSHDEFERLLGYLRSGAEQQRAAS